MAEEVAGARHQRRLEDLRGRSLLDDAALVEDDHPVGDALGEIHLVGDHHHGHALVGQRLHHCQHLADGLGIERRGRLVEQHDVGLHGERAGDRHPLLLAARQRRRMLARLIGQADLAQQLGGPRLGRRARHLQYRGRADADVAQHGQVGEQLEVLEHHAYTLAQPENGAAAALDVDALEGDAPAVDRLQPVGAAQQRRLARAAGADQADDLAAVNLEADAVERHQRAVALDHLLEQQDRRRVAADPDRGGGGSHRHSTTL